MQLLAWIAHTRTAASRAGAYARVPLPSLRAVLEFHTRTTLCPHAGVPHSRDARSRWSFTLARRRASHAGVLHSRDAIRRSADDGCIPLSGDVHHLPRSCPASPQTVPTSCFRATWCISYETVVRYCRRSPRSAFEQRVASAMRPSCVTADGSHVLLSSDVVYQQ